MDFIKMHGLGNDFIIFESPSWDESFKLQQYAESFCDRKFGIGADGLVVVGKNHATDLFMRIFNPDGTEAEMCGNAIRCIALYAKDKGWSNNDTLSVKTVAGIKYPELIKTDNNTLIRVDMGTPILERSEIPIRGSGSNLDIAINFMGTNYIGDGVSMGNPHFVICVENIESLDIQNVGPYIEKHELFPAKTNVEFIKILNPAEIQMRVWERGAGETLACGTGACAVLVAAVLKGLCEREALIHLPGGNLIIEWSRQNNHVYMTGPAEYVFTGSVKIY